MYVISVTAKINAQVFSISYGSCYSCSFEVHVANHSVNAAVNLLPISLRLFLTITERQHVDCVRLSWNILCQLWEGTDPSPSLTGSHLSVPTMLWCAIKSSLPAPSKNTPDWYLTAWWWGRGAVFHFPFLFPLSICDPVPFTWDLREVSSRDCGCSNQSQYRRSCFWLQSLLQIEKWTKKRRSVWATSPLPALYLSSRGNSRVLEHSGSLG